MHTGCINGNRALILKNFCILTISNCGKSEIILMSCKILIFQISTSHQNWDCKSIFRGCVIHSLLLFSTNTTFPYNSNQMRLKLPAAKIEFLLYLVVRKCNRWKLFWQRQKRKRTKANRTREKTFRILLFLHSCNLIIHELTAKWHLEKTKMHNQNEANCSKANSYNFPTYFQIHK